MPGWDFAHVQDDVNMHILRMLESILSLVFACVALEKYDKAPSN